MAKNWDILPWEVDDAPTDEVLLEIRLHNIDTEAENERAKRAASG